MPDRLQGKRCFLTAAGQGIGHAAALAFAAEGAAVVATDRDMAKVSGLSGHGISVRALDVTDDAAVTAVLRDTGPVDVLFNCAGFVHQNTAITCAEEDWEFAFALNVRSMWRTIRAVLPGMLERSAGSIINMSSAASSVKGAPNRFLYGTTKAAVIGLTKSVAAQAGSLEAARTAFIARQAMGRLGTPEEIASLAVWLASDESAFVTGQAIVIDGGWTL